MPVVIAVSFGTLPLNSTQHYIQPGISVSLEVEAEWGSTRKTTRQEIDLALLANYCNTISENKQLFSNQRLYFALIHSFEVYYLFLTVCMEK